MDDVVRSIKQLLEAEIMAGTGETFVKRTEDKKPGKKKSVTFEELQGEVAGCFKCELADLRTNVVFGEGSRNADLLFIGEAPGIQEDIQGKAHVGPCHLPPETGPSLGLNGRGCQSNCHCHRQHDSTAHLRHLVLLPLAPSKALRQPGLFFCSLRRGSSAVWSSRFYYCGRPGRRNVKPG